MIHNLSKDYLIVNNNYNKHFTITDCKYSYVDNIFVKHNIISVNLPYLSSSSPPHTHTSITICNF